jgi:DNA modification methylase
MVTEPILFTGEKPLNKNFSTDILEFMTDRVEGLVHACPKPIKLIAEIITTLTDNGKTILDLFLGSGSTLIACEQTNRICYGMELDEKYIDVCRRRYWKFVNNGDETGWETNTPAIVI